MQLIAGRTAQEYNRRKNRNVKSELGSEAMHRDIEHIDGAYALREQSEVYDGNLIGDTATKMLELPRDNVVRSVTPSSMMKLAQLICCLLSLVQWLCQHRSGFAAQETRHP